MPLALGFPGYHGGVSPTRARRRPSSVSRSTPRTGSPPRRPGPLTRMARSRPGHSGSRQPVSRILHTPSLLPPSSCSRSKSASSPHARSSASIASLTASPRRTRSAAASPPCWLPTPGIRVSRSRWSFLAPLRWRRCPLRCLIPLQRGDLHNCRGGPPVHS